MIIKQNFFRYFNLFHSNYTAIFHASKPLFVKFTTDDLFESIELLIHSSYCSKGKLIDSNIPLEIINYQLLSNYQLQPFYFVTDHHHSEQILKHNSLSHRETKFSIYFETK